MADTLYNVSVFDYKRNKLCDLYDSQNNLTGQAYDIKHDEDIDGLDTLDFSIPYMVDESVNFRWKYLKNEYLIRLAKDNKYYWFVAQRPKKSKSRKDITGTVHCESIAILLKTKNISKYFDDENGIGTIEYLLGQIISGTEWRLGSVDPMLEKDGITEKVRSLSSSGNDGALALIQKVCNMFRARPVFDTDAMTIDIRLMNNREQVIGMMVGHNIDALDVQYDSNDIITRMYVEGEYGDYGYVGIDDVNPTGLTYLMNFDYYKEIGVFTEEHQEALDDYLDTMPRIVAQITANQALINEEEDELNALIGQCILSAYYTSTGFTTPRYTYGSPTAAQQALTTGDKVYVFNTDGTFRNETIESDPSSLIESGDYAIVKFATPSAGSAGAKETQIDAKNAEIANLERKRDATSKQEKKAEYQREIDALEADIERIYNATDGLYDQMDEIFREGGKLAVLDGYQRTYQTLTAQQDSVEADFIIAMDNMLRDGKWSNTNYITGQEQELYDDAVDVMEQMSKPTASYKFDYIRLSQEYDIPLEDIQINAIIRVEDDDLDLNDNMFISHKSTGIDDKSYGEITISNKDITLGEGTLSQLLSRMSQLSDMIDQKNAIYERAKAISKSGTFYADRVNGNLNVMTTKIMSSVSNWYTDDSGNLVFLSADGGSAVMLSGAGILLASSKKEDGSWNWRAALDGTGMTADEIVAGFLSADRIEAGSISTDKLEPGIGNSLVISGNPSITQINSQFAPEFSTSQAYETGDLVMKDGIVYVFISDHDAGAWNANEVQATNIASQIELLPDQIIQYVGQQGYGRTFFSPTDPALDESNNVAPGDYWVKQDENAGTWGAVKNKTWNEAKNSTWFDLFDGTAEMYCRKGSGQSAEWVPVTNKDVISMAYTQITQTKDAITQEAYRANQAEGELHTLINQTAEGIRSEAARSYLSKSGDYQTVDAIIAQSEQLANAAATSAKNASIAKTSTLQTAEAIVNTAVAQAASSASGSYIAKTSTYQTVESIVTEAVRQAASSASGSYIAKTSTYQTAESIVTAAQTYTNNQLSNYSTTSQTATAISAYVTNNAYSLVSGITITADGIAMTGSKYITLESAGYVKIQNWKFNNKGFVHSDGSNDDFTFCHNSSMFTNPPTGLYYSRDSAGTTAVTLLARASNNGAVIWTLEKKSDDIVGCLRPNSDYDANIGDSSHHVGSIYVREIHGGPGFSVGISPKVIIYPSASDATYGVVIEPDTTNSYVKMRQVSSSAYLYITGYISAPSSITYKHNIRSIENTGKIIDNLNPVSFIYNNDPNERVKYGLIYEETIGVLPEICIADNTMKSIEYTMLVPILLKEIQNLRKRVKVLENK